MKDDMKDPTSGEHAVPAPHFSFRHMGHKGTAVKTHDFLARKTGATRQSSKQIFV